jgi:YgiT-type zinc finger domain-containing protein
MQPGKTTVTLERDAGVVVIRDVPAQVCEACGEYYLTPEVTDHVLARAERALANGGEVGILRYAA